MSSRPFLSRKEKLYINQTLKTDYYPEVRVIPTSSGM
jgi:hypothetical protein